MPEAAGVWPHRRFEVVPARRGGWVLQRWQGPVLAEDWFEADPADEPDQAEAYDCAVAAGETWVTSAGGTWMASGEPPPSAAGGEEP